MAKIHQNRHDDLRSLLQIRGERRKILIATQPGCSGAFFVRNVRVFAYNRAFACVLGPDSVRGRLEKQNTDEQFPVGSTGFCKNAG